MKITFTPKPHIDWPKRTTSSFKSLWEAINYVEANGETGRVDLEYKDPKHNIRVESLYYQNGARTAQVRPHTTNESER